MQSKERVVISCLSVAATLNVTAKIYPATSPHTLKVVIIVQLHNIFGGEVA